MSSAGNGTLVLWKSSQGYLNHKAISLALFQILEMGVVLGSSALSDLLLTLVLLLRAWEQRK